jgi:hypothetical protein
MVSERVCGVRGSDSNLRQQPAIQAKELPLNDAVLFTKRERDTAAAVDATA